MQKIKELKEEHLSLIDLANKCIDNGEFDTHNELGYSIIDFAKLLSKIDELDKIIDLDTKAKDKKEKSKIRAFITRNKEEILQLHNNKCDVCELEIEDILEIHHILPMSNGGDNSLDNLSCLCPNCHAILHKILSDCSKDIEDLKFSKLLQKKLSYESYNRLLDIFAKSVKKGALN